jgi:hypothetical protein
MFGRRFTVKPRDGQTQGVEKRLKAYAAVGNAHGFDARVSRIIDGPTAGCMALSMTISTMGAAMKARANLVADPKWVALEKEREASPNADRIGETNIVRFMSGAPDPANYPVSLIRIYLMSRAILPELLKIGEEARKIAASQDMNLALGTPIVGDSMNRFIVNYQARSLEHLGECIDKVVVLPEYPEILIRVAGLATISTAVIDVTV